MNLINSPLFIYLMMYSTHIFVKFYLRGIHGHIKTFSSGSLMRFISKLTTCGLTVICRQTYGKGPLSERKTRCRQCIPLAAKHHLYAPSHRQDSTYHGLCYTSRVALSGTRNSFWWKLYVVGWRWFLSAVSCTWLVRDGLRRLAAVRGWLEMVSVSQQLYVVGWRWSPSVGSCTWLVGDSLRQSAAVRGWFEMVSISRQLYMVG